METNKQVKPRSTLKYPLVINPQRDAEKIYKAVKLITPDQDVINEILGHRSFQQRLAIQQEYKRLYNKEIAEHIGTVLVGSYDSLVKTLFRKPFEILANDLYKGMKTIGSNYQIMTDIICCCNNAEIYLLKKAYNDVLMKEDPKNYRQRPLQTDVLQESKGAFRLLMEQLLKGERCGDDIDGCTISTPTSYGYVNRKLVDDDVRELYAAGMGQEGKGDPSIYISILTKRSKYHIREVYEAYHKKYGHLLTESISRKFSNPLRNALNTLLMALIDLRLLLTCQLYCSMEGLGSNDDSIIRIICLRCEIDLQDIKELYEKCFYQPLAKTLQSETRGGFKNLLLILLNCE
uniref:Annexin n=1 Tax=Schistosoma japonicum TaxID=6182 RepID=C1LKN7_SCHJA|nr:Annexin-B12 (Annexin-12) [Schistosoma japonicum]